MDNVRKIILTRGIQGSGKSTWAKQWAEEDPEHRIRFNNDDIRNMLGKYWVPSREGLIKSMKENFLGYSMSKGYDIIIDNMNLSPKEVKYFQDIINSRNKATLDIPDNAKIETLEGNVVNKDSLYLYKLEFKDFKTPLDVCIERDSKRENPIGAGIITSTYNRYKNFYEEESNNC